MIPSNSPVLKALKVDQKLIQCEQRMLRAKIQNRMEAASKAIEQIGKLAIYNPTKIQCESIIQSLRDEIDELEKKLNEIKPRQITFQLE